MEELDNAEHIIRISTMYIMNFSLFCIKNRMTKEDYMEACSFTWDIIMEDGPEKVAIGLNSIMKQDI